MKVRSRFSYFRDKFQVFILGLLFGLVLGGGFFVLKLDQYVKELSFYKSLTEKDNKTGAVIPEEENEDEQEAKPKKVKKPAVKDSSTVVSANDKTPGDTALPTVYNGNHTNGDIVIRKDEQLAEKTYSIINLDSKKTDSLGGKEIPQMNLAVEFWKSPLNYHGYKFVRNKLVLFGYGDQDIVSVFKVDNTTVLKCLTGVFKIEPTTEFQQLERITDEYTLSKIQ
ncbi:MAG: hypothetical protein M3R17_00755 [Bacteroidota bacterium]|nr:hypothetical protein [Bacteroidota bacterium]